jgi:Flp pilus assembly protein TadG
MMPSLSRLIRRLRRLRRDHRGVVIIEYAIGLPALLVLGMYGMETANFAIANLRVNQIAMITADNASRLQSPLDEADINQLLFGAKKVGTRINFAANGRIILSDVEKTTAGNGQYMRWQRCSGALNFTSSYGTPTTLTNVSGNTTTQIGPTGNQVAAATGLTVMFVEVQYTYQPLITNKFIGARTIHAVAAVDVRSGVGAATTNYTSATTSSCSTFSA